MLRAELHAPLGSHWDLMEFLLACWCLPWCGKKKRKERPTCRSLWAEFRISQDHFQGMETCLHIYFFKYSTAVAVLYTCSPYSFWSSYAFKRKWIAAKYSLHLNTDYWNPGSFAGYKSLGLGGLKSTIHCFKEPLTPPACSSLIDFQCRC